jgi:hypothetical protein
VWELALNTLTSAVEEVAANTYSVEASDDTLIVEAKAHAPRNCGAGNAGRGGGKEHREGAPVDRAAVERNRDAVVAAGGHCVRAEVRAIGEVGRGAGDGSATAQAVGNHLDHKCAAPNAQAVPNGVCGGHSESHLQGFWVEGFGFVVWRLGLWMSI